MQVLLGDQGDGNIVNVQLMLADEVDQKVHRPLEDVLHPHGIGLKVHVPNHTGPGRDPQPSRQRIPTARRTSWSIGRLYARAFSAPWRKSRST